MSKSEFIELFLNAEEEVTNLIENLLTDFQQPIGCELEH